jgi:multidrug efflux system membrane fusion protein
VYVVKADETVEVRPVTLGPAEGETIAVVSGVADGETVVTDGVDKLQDGTKVAARDEAGAAEDAKKDGQPAITPAPGAKQPPDASSTPSSPASRPPPQSPPQQKSKKP